MRILMRFPTEAGPRTVVAQNITKADAVLVAECLRHLGGDAHVDEDSVRVSLADYIQRQKAAVQKATKRILAKKIAQPAVRLLEFKTAAKAK